MSRSKLYKFDKIGIETSIRELGVSKRWLAHQLDREYSGFLKRFNSGRMTKIEYMAITKVLEEYENEMAEGSESLSGITWGDTIEAWNNSKKISNAGMDHIKNGVKSLGELLIEWADDEEEFIDIVDDEEDEEDE